MQFGELWGTIDFFVSNFGVVPLERVKVLATVAQNGVNEEAAIAIDIRIWIGDQPVTARLKSLYLVWFNLGARVGKRIRQDIEPWRRDIKMWACAA